MSASNSSSETSEIVDLKQHPILYEYPINEKIRTFLRLEDLFQRIEYFLESDSPYEHHAALSALFDIAEISVKPELKSELIAELDRQKQTLLSYKDDPNVLTNVLNSTISDIQSIIDCLISLSSKLGQHIKKNDWLMSIRNRINIPGGTCEFDLPNYHWWLCQFPEIRVKIFRNWLSPFEPLTKSFTLILRLLRGSGHLFEYTAENSTFSLNFSDVDLSQDLQLARVIIDRSIAAVPEISGNKHTLNIRFTKSTLSELKPKNYDENDGKVPFKLILC